jgi:hypothetical protein
VASDIQPTRAARDRGCAPAVSDASRMHTMPVTNKASLVGFIVVSLE